MTQLLVSVRNAREAQDALAGGADLIDVKEPLHGSLGAASPQALAAVLHAMAGHAPVSAALGELQELSESGSIGSQTLVALRSELPGVQFAKIGLSGCDNQRDWPTRWREQLSKLPASCGAVAVVYADRVSAGSPSPAEIVAIAHEFDCSAVLVDTFLKDGNDLLYHWPLAELCRFADEVRSRSLRLVLAGSLSAGTIPTVLQARPDYIAVRGAACNGARSASISRERVGELKRLLLQSSATQLRCTLSS